MHILEDLAGYDEGMQKVEGHLCVLSEGLFYGQAVFESAQNDLEFFPEMLISDELTLIKPGSQLSQRAWPPIVVSLAFFAHHLKLTWCDLKRLKEALSAVIVLKNIKQLARLDLPARALPIGQHIANRLFIRGHAGEHRRDPVFCHFAEIALPLATGALLCIAHALNVVSHRAVVA